MDHCWSLPAFQHPIISIICTVTHKVRLQCNVKTGTFVSEATFTESLNQVPVLTLHCNLTLQRQQLCVAGRYTQAPHNQIFLLHGCKMIWATPFATYNCVNKRYFVILTIAIQRVVHASMEVSEVATIQRLGNVHRTTNIMVHITRKQQCLGLQCSPVE